MLNKKIIKKEISLVHLILLVTGKLFIGIAIGIMIAQYALPYSFPLLVVGILILLPALSYLFREEEKEETALKKRLK